MNTFVPTITGEWLNLEKIKFLSVAKLDNDENYYVIASFNITYDEKDGSVWILSKHQCIKDAQKSLDRMMFHMSPVPNLGLFEDCYESYQDVAKHLYYLKDEVYEEADTECGSN